MELFFVFLFFCLVENYRTTLSDDVGGYFCLVYTVDHRS